MTTMLIPHIRKNLTLEFLLTLELHIIRNKSVQDYKSRKKMSNDVEI